MKQKGITKYVCIKQYSFERNKTVENKKTKEQRYEWNQMS